MNELNERVVEYSRERCVLCSATRERSGRVQLFQLRQLRDIDRRVVTGALPSCHLHFRSEGPQFQVCEVAAWRECACDCFGGCHFKFIGERFAQTGHSQYIQHLPAIQNSFHCLFQVE